MHPAQARSASEAKRWVELALLMASIGPQPALGLAPMQMMQWRLGGIVKT